MGAASLAAHAQTAGGGLLSRTWTAKWIAVPGAPANDYGVYHFRRTVTLAAKPSRFLVHASGDNRYQLFVNGTLVALGPARGDLFHWRYETVDVSPYLKAGANLFAAVVWNFAEMAPEAQVTLQTGFLLQGDSGAESIVDTGANWKCLRNLAYSPIEFTSGQMHGYYVAGPGDNIAADKYPWGWEKPGFDDSSWHAASVLGVAAGREASDPHSRWMLVPRSIPAEERRPEQSLHLRRATGVPLPARLQGLQIPPRTQATLLLDQTYLTTTYPELTVSGGRGARIRMKYAEALFPKTNRDVIEGKQFLGNYDEFHPDGGAARRFQPLWWRTYRYLQLEVQTTDAPLTIDDLAATYVGFPFQRRATFEGGDPEINRILDVGWRTARLCAHETYMDCPYYEQLQYVGDTRVQCLVSLFSAGDGRLMRNAIDQINDSRQSDGCTMSRYPTRLEQYIPGFSLWWIGMVHDYWWYVDDPAFVRRMLPGWRYLDWVPQWKGGDPPQQADGSSAPFDIQLLMAYRWAAALEKGLGIASLGSVYAAREQQLRQTVQDLYWDAGRNLYADTPAKQQFSQHTNTLAVLADVITGDPARQLVLRILHAPELAQTGLFFRFYLHQALTKVGEGDRYLEQLDDWRAMLARGLTTFAEIVERPGGETSRSDCHAWSASPNIEIFRTVLGVDSASPGFQTVSVTPHLGKLKSVKGAVPHPKGLITVTIDGDSANVTLPPGVTGELLWKGERRKL